MQVGNISLASQRFALTRCNCSSSSQGKKTRKRKSKEERRAMVETFITNFRETNEGTFPSLNITHREVGGSFYIVREIVRDIIQENRVLGPGDLDMQTLTLEDVPVSPEICENGTGTDLGKDLVGNVHLDMQTLSLDEESVIAIETETIEKFESEMKEERSEIVLNNGSLTETSDKSYEIKEMLTEISQNNGKFSTGDLHEESPIELKSETSDKSYEIKEMLTEISQNNGQISIGHLHEESLDIKTEIVDKSEFEINEGKGEISQNEGELSTKMEVKTEIIEKSGFGMKEERSEISHNYGKISTAEMEKFEELGLGFGDSKSNDGFERAKRTVVQVEQFPLPSKSHSLQKKDSDCDLADGKKIEQQTVDDVNSKMEIEKKKKNSISSTSAAQEKNIGAVSKTKNEAVSSNTTKTNKRPINEYLLQRHESHLNLDFMTSEIISMDASINRETTKKKREKTQANPFWVTFQAFITSVIKFWSE